MRVLMTCWPGISYFFVVACGILVEQRCAENRKCHWGQLSDSVMKKAKVQDCPIWKLKSNSVAISNCVTVFVVN